MTPFRENLRGIAAISACNLLFLVNDAQLKLANEELPLGEILFIRGLFATLLLLPVVWVSGAYRVIGLVGNPALIWRTIAEVLAALFFLIALFHIPIANVNAILQVVPLMLTAAAAVFLGERVGWRRWTAIIIGFLGVIVVIRPGLAGFDAHSLVALVSMVFITLRDMMTRVMPRHLPAVLVAFVTAVAVCVGGGLFGLAIGEDWVVPGWRSLTLLVGATVFLIGGYLTAVDFMRHGDIAVVAPFRYSVVIWAIIAGYLVWGEIPDMPMLVGTAIIVATGVYTFRRERNLARAAAEAVDL